MSQEPAEIPTSRAFEFNLPAGWTTDADEEGGLLMASEQGDGLLHLISFEQLPGELLDPADELYAFLEDREIELEEDEIEDLVLPGGHEMALCEYVEEDPDEEGDGDAEATYWLVAVATAPGNLVFCSYSCPLGLEERENAIVRQILGALVLRTL